MRYSMRVLATVVAAALSGPVFAQQSTMQNGGMSGMAPLPSPADQAFMDGMGRMNKEMNVPMTGDADRDFVTMMIPHHQGAIDMAETELRYGKDPAIRKLAKDIIAAQKSEIAEMKTWLAQPEH